MNKVIGGQTVRDAEKVDEDLFIEREHLSGGKRLTVIITSPGMRMAIQIGAIVLVIGHIVFVMIRGG